MGGWVVGWVCCVSVKGLFLCTGTQLINQAGFKLKINILCFTGDRFKRMHNSIQLLFCFIGHFHYVAQAGLELNYVVQTDFTVTEIHLFFSLEY